jgi:hypothetical protein
MQDTPPCRPEIVKQIAGGFVRLGDVISSEREKSSARMIHAPRKNYDTVSIEE